MRRRLVTAHQATREALSATLTPSTALGGADGDRCTGSPAAIASATSASSTKASLLRAGARTMTAKLRVVINAGSQKLWVKWVCWRQHFVERNPGPNQRSAREGRSLRCEEFSLILPSQSSWERQFAFQALRPSHAGSGAIRATGFYTIGRLISAESTPNRIANHQTRS